MKIIVSPTKSMKRKQLDLPLTKAPFQNESDVLRNILKGKTLTDLKQLYKASDKVVAKAYDYFSNEASPVAALSLYDGLVFKQLKLSDYGEQELQYLNENVIILSALYGALHVSDAIMEYRLDYLMPFDYDLYDYWKAHLSAFFSEDDLIVNLASTEFSTSFDHDNVVNVHFVNAQGKTQATAAKMARGDMLNYLVEHHVLDLEGIKKYNNLHYVYDDVTSTSSDLYFVLEEK